MGLENPLHLLLIAIVIVMVFGAKRLPELGRSLGRGMREFKESVSGEERPPELAPTKEAPPRPAHVEPRRRRPILRRSAVSPTSHAPPPRSKHRPLVPPFRLPVGSGSSTGLAGLTPGVLATEKDAPDSSSPAGSLRIAIGRARTSVVRRVTALTGDSSPKGDSLPNARTPH